MSIYEKYITILLSFLVRQQDLLDVNIVMGHGHDSSIVEKTASSFPLSSVAESLQSSSHTHSIRVPVPPSTK